ncbi:MAG: hypothetical protein ALECFALPRED_006634 [Alectoria fallacina]|uniref:Cytochrome P450 n=1 Tax=Alectoria fallacina TaxID=1903189 RepID=A0A8H3G6Y7_9LECA|nr:MAG: hypothetical protein ALECFALPRED_006634 [Alectoria fallacina]
MEISTVLVEFTFVAIVLYTAYGIIYRLYLSPIAHFPGRKLAALTLWYEFYFDVIKRGSYVWEIQEMHQTYGPIIRINPYELHVADSDFIDQLYPTVAKNVEKWSWSAGMFGSTGMTFGTVGHTLHRRRRGAFSNFFSKTSVRRLQPVIQSRIDILCKKLSEKMDTGEPVNMVHAYSALTQDVITEYCFSRSRNVLEMKDFSPWYYELVQKPSELSHMIKQFPYMLPVLNLLPDWWICATNPLFAHFRAQQLEYVSQVQTILFHNNETGSESHPTVFHSLRDDDDLPLSEKSLPRLVMEAKSLVGAGTLTSAHMLSMTTYHVLMNPPILSKLMAELEEAIPDVSIPCSLQNLEQIPYLGAVINEGLRISYGSVHRLQRVHPDTALNFRDWTIPPGTPVGMSSVHMHNDPAMFPEPRKFDPSRWMGPEKDLRQRNLFNFGRGTRQCVGMNLAQAEIHMALATILRKFGTKMRLFDTVRERDVDVKHDFFVTNPSLDSRGVRVTLHSNSRKT